MPDLFVLIRTLKALSWFAMVVSGLAAYLDPSLPNVGAMLAAIVTALATYITEARHAPPATRSAHPTNKPGTPPSTAAPTSEPAPAYARQIGARLRFIRGQALDLTLREMTEFLELASVTQLERYEHGDEEYPLRHIRRLEEFFFLNRAFLEARSEVIFSSFHLTSENVAKYLEQGFKPTLVCNPRDRHDLLCFLAFSKQEHGQTRLRVADRPGSFASSGGGRLNIQDLIFPMLESGMSVSEVSIVTALPRDWTELRDGTYYSRHPFTRAGSADWDCMRIFDRWFKECSQALARTATHPG